MASAHWNLPRRVCLAGVLGLAATCASAEADKPLQLVVGLPAGGTVDILARQIAEGLRGKLNRTVLVENRPGAGGIAMERVKNAPPDGNTLLVSPTTAFTLYPLTVEKLPYKPADFAPVVHIARFEYAFGVGSAVPAHTVKEYVALVKRDSRFGMYGAPGLGGPPQFYGQMFASKFGLDMTTVPYPGTPPLMQDLQGGQTPAAMLPLAELGKLVNGGKARLIATTGVKRAKDFPNVPTFLESGVPVAEYGQYAIYAPAGAPTALLEPIARAVQEVLQTTAVKARYSTMYMEPTGQTGAALQKQMADSTAFWTATVRANPSVAKAGDK
jgi:tripartite-type tricarboxylate transporter receptor subunit TctC